MRCQLACLAMLPLIACSDAAEQTPAEPAADDTPEQAAPAEPMEETVETRHCQFDSRSGESYAGPCTQRYAAGSTVLEVTFPEHEFSIADLDPPQVDWNLRFMQINNEPVIAYVHHRSYTEYTRSDLEYVLHVCESGDEFGTC